MKKTIQNIAMLTLATCLFTACEKDDTDFSDYINGTVSTVNTISIVYKHDQPHREIFLNGVSLGISQDNSGNTKENPVYAGAALKFAILPQLSALTSTASFDYIKIYEKPTTTDVTLKNAQRTDINQLTVEFNTSMNVSKVEASNFVISDGIKVNKVTPADDSGTAFVLTTDAMEMSTPYTLSVTEAPTTLGGLISKEIDFLTREPMQKVTEISFADADVLEAGEQKLNVSLLNEKNEGFTSLLIGVHKSADYRINKIDAIPLSTELLNDTMTPSVTVDAEDASLQLFAIKSFAAPYAVSSVVEYTAAGKKVLEKSDVEGASVSGLTATYEYLQADDYLSILLDLPDEELRTAVLLILEEGKKLSDIDPAKPGETILYIGAAQPEEGKLTYGFTVGTGNAVLPILAYNSDGGKFLDESYDYISPTYVATRLGELNLTEDISFVDEFVTEFSKLLYANGETDEYALLTADGAHDYISTILLQQRATYGPDGQYPSLTELKTELDVAVQLAKIYYSNQAASVLTENKDLTDANAYEVFTTYMLEEAQAYLVDVLRELPKVYTVADMKNLIGEEIYTAAVYKAVNRKQIAPVIRLAGIDMADYDDLNSKKAVDNELLGTLYDTTELLGEAFDTAVEKQEKKESSGGSNGGSMGGSFSKPITITPQEPEENKEPEEVQHPFTDLGDYSWAEERICALYHKGVIAGKDADSYDPAASVTRAEFVKMLCSALKLESKEGNNPFADISSEDWYYTYVLTAYENGITGGVTETTFAPNAVVTREMAATLLKRGAGDIFKAGTKEFNDSAEISDWATEAVSLLAANGVINGYETGSFRPQGELNRAEAAKLIYEILKTGGNI